MNLKPNLFVLSAVACLTLTGWFTAPASAQFQENPMWQRRNPRLTNPYTDIKASKVGDLLVIVVNEKSDVENKDRRSLTKQGNSDVSVDGSYGLSGGLGGATGGGTVDEQSSSSRNFAGNTQFKSEREFIDRFTVTVEDVLPNGNLLVRGERDVSIEGDLRRLTLTGIVRQFDVTYANTISSQNVANLTIRYTSSDEEGAERQFLNQGWIGRKLNRWWGRR